ncbi:MAG: CARDB domain-containing protein, partial [Candidatus Methanofastidiosia archaeon]
KGGILHFREYPDTECTEHCVGCTPVLYEAEVIFVPYYGDPFYVPQALSLTYIPPGRYLVTSPSFHISNNVRVWYFYDDGTGPVMDAHLETEDEFYELPNSTQVVLYVTDQFTGKRIQVDTITGTVILPDETEEEIPPGMWTWNQEEKQYECDWHTIPMEGRYCISVTAKKALYNDAEASTTFEVCYGGCITLLFDRNPPVYEENETVHMTATATDDDGNPVSGGISGTVTREGYSDDLEWEEVSPGIYEASYTPIVAGTYHVEIHPFDQEGVCYVPQTFEFEVKHKGRFSCGIPDGEIEDLAHMYSPYVYFYGGIGEEEKFFPTPVETMLENSTLWRYDPSVEEGRVEISGYTEAANKGEFLRRHSSSENHLDLKGPPCSIDESVFAEQLNDRHVYCRVACFGYERKEYIVIQYWFFYIFEDHFLDHEGDWEVVQVLLDGQTRCPMGICISRGDDAEYHLWDEIRKRGTHPEVHIAEGSHGGYFSEGAFFFSDGFLDITSNDGWSGILFNVSSLKTQDWLWFRGNWGTPRILACLRWLGSSPYGPMCQEDIWNDPVEWALSHYDNSPQTIESPYTLFSLSCPADVLITNNAGQRLGFVNEEFVQEIPNAYVQDCDEREFYIIQGIDQYQVEVTGTGEGTFDLVCVTSLWNTTRTMKYKDVSVTASTRAVLNLGSDPSLNVDVDLDGITDLAVLPVSVDLSSQSPIKPLHVGGKMTYELTLANEGEPSTFLLEVDTPLSWSYSLSSETLSLNTGESATILLRVTSPSDTPVQDYTIRIEATSLEDDDITADMTLTASSKAELMPEEITVSPVGQEEIVITASVSNMGLLPANNVKIQFFTDSPSERILLGEQIVSIPSGETTPASIYSSLPDGLYTFLVSVDPDNLYDESSESNNELSIQCLLDRTPPEAELFFDVHNEDIKVRGVDNLGSVEISVIEENTKNRMIRTYTLTDDAGNATELIIEIQHAGKEIKVEITSLKYNSQPVSLPENQLKIEYLVEESNIEKLNQFLLIGDIQIHLIYHRTKDCTQLIVAGKDETRQGAFVVILQTWRGTLQYALEEIGIE